ncbi:MAG: bifunctional ornithine acetyltransferase/N-acetylglutamate synthase, partial [Thiotrichales bacterium]|nr:bifunctional ornithine acetyltransferase/N-acetylglutamate synthase [Thiotrichales bacterium]
MSQQSSMHPIAGFYLGSTQAKIKKNGKTDLVVIEMVPEAVTAATFTLNAFCAAPVTVAKQHLQKQMPRALLINSGNANAGTGEQGLKDALQTCQWVADELGCSAQEVLPFSTGVIGQNLPMEKMQLGIAEASASLSITGWEGACAGIMTTDTVPKTYSKTVQIGNSSITLTGIAKGSGMIHPNMATMLGFAATDAKITQACLQQCLSDAVKVS